MLTTTLFVYVAFFIQVLGFVSLVRVRGGQHERATILEIFYQLTLSIWYFIHAAKSVSCMSDKL